MIKTTDKQYKEFVAEVYKLQKEWGLTDWKIYCDMKKLTERYAQCDSDLQGKCATISLAIELSHEDAKQLVPKQKAKHEMIHLLLSELYGLATTKFVSELQLEMVEESIVRRLEKLL